MTAKEKMSFLIRCGLRFSSDESRIMDIIREEIDKTPTTSEGRQNMKENARKSNQVIVNKLQKVLDNTDRIDSIDIRIYGSRVNATMIDYRITEFIMPATGERIEHG